jgi:hypothetical protein
MGVEEAVRKATDRLLGEARASYQRGYRSGAEAASHIPWGALDRLAEDNWQLREWRAHLYQLDRQGFGWSALDFEGEDFQGFGAKSMTTLLDHELGSPLMGDQVTLTFEAGFTQALRDVWEAVRSSGDNN